MKRTLGILIIVSTMLACDSSTDSTKGTAAAANMDAKPVAATKQEAKNEAKTVLAKADEAKADAAKADAAKADEAKALDAKVAEVKAATAPANAEEAARQVAAFLGDPSKAPAPALVSATSEVELREFCGACDGKDKKTPKTGKITGADALAKRARELADAAPAGAVSAEDKVTCKKDCCTFVPEPGMGVGDNVVNLEQVCLALDAAGKPTAVTRIDVSGSW